MMPIMFLPISTSSSAPISMIDGSYIRGLGSVEFSVDRPGKSNFAVSPISDDSTAILTKSSSPEPSITVDAASPMRPCLMTRRARPVVLLVSRRFSLFASNDTGTSSLVTQYASAASAHLAAFLSKLSIATYLLQPRF